MAKSCIWNPKKGEQLLKELRQELGNTAAATIYNYALGAQFQNAFKDSLTFDSEGIPTFDSVIQVPEIQESIGVSNVLRILSKKEPVLEDTQLNAKKLQERAQLFNQASRDKVALVDFAEGNNITIRIVEATQDNIQEAKRQQAVFKANELIADLLEPMGITIGTVSALESAVGRVGVTQFSRVMSTVDQYEALIRVANNLEGAIALSEEFSHTVIGILSHLPIVKRAINYMADPAHAREVLGDQYEEVADFYDNDAIAIAEEAVGQVFREQFLERVNREAPKQRSSLLKRLFNFILNLFKGRDAQSFHSEAQSIRQGLTGLAEEIVTGQRVLTKQDINKAQREAEFNALSKHAEIQVKVMKNMAERAYKAAALIDNLEDKNGDLTEKGRARKFAEAIETSMKRNVNIGETMAAIASFIDYSVRVLKQYQQDLEEESLEKMDIGDRLTLIRNALYMIGQFKEDVNELLPVVGDEFINSKEDESGIITQAFMMEDYSNRLAPFENKVPIGRHENIGNTPEEIIHYIEEQSKKIELAAHGKFYVNKETNERNMRVTQVIEADKDAEAPMEEDSPWTTPSTNIGTGIDELIRDIIEGAIYYDTTDNQYKTVKGNKHLDEVYPNSSRDQLNAFARQIMGLKEQLTSMGIKLFSRNIVVNGTITTIDGANNSHIINVAGTIDLIGYNSKTGKWKLYDFKTHRGRITQDKMNKWRRQLTLYKKFLEEKYEIEIEEINIIPVKVGYPTPKGVDLLATAEYEVSNEEKPQEYNGVQNNQLLMNGKEYKSANPVLEDILSTEVIPLNLLYSILADDPSNGRNSPDFVVNAVNTLLRLVHNIDIKVQALAKKEFINFIKPIVGETIRIPNPEDRSKMMEVPLSRVLERAEYDSTFMQAYFTTLADNPDAFLQIIDKVYKRAMDLKRLKAITAIQQIQVLAMKYEKLGITEYSWMYEEDNRHYIDKRFNRAAYAKARKQKWDELLAKYGNAEYNTEEGRQMRREFKLWKDQNQVLMEIDGEEQLVPDPAKYPSNYDKLDTTAKQFYEEWINIKASLDALLGPRKTHISDTIKIRRRGIERFKTSFTGEAIQNMINSAKAAVLRSYDDSETKYKDTVNTIKDFEDREVMKLPLYYIDDNIHTSYEDLSHDAIGTLIAYADMAINYEALNSIVNPLEVGRIVARKRKIVDTSGSKKKVESFRRKGTERQESEVLKPTESTHFWELLNNFFESKIYNRFIEDSGDLWEGGPDTNKLVSILLKIGSMAQLGMNAIAHTANLLTGGAMTNIEAITGEVFTARQLAAADAELMHHLLPEYALDVGKRIKKSKLALLIDYFDIRQDFKSRQKNRSFLNRTILGQIFGPRLQFIGQDIGDLYLYSRTAIAILMGTEVLKRNKNGEYESTSLYDCLEVVPIDPEVPEAGNKLVISEGTLTLEKIPVTPEFISDVTGKIRFINQKLFGVYNEEDQIMVRRKIVGRFLMQYRDWYPPALRRRFGARTTNLEGGMEVEGFYRTTWRFIRGLASELRHGQLAIKEAWGALDETEQRNIYRASTEIFQYIVVCIIVGMFGMLKDRKDIWGDKKQGLTLLQRALRYGSLFASRERVELGSLAISPEMVQQTAKQAKSPVANTSILSNISACLELLWLPTWFDEIEQGDYKGHSRAYRIFINSPATLWYNTVKRALNPEKAERFFTAVS